MIFHALLDYDFQFISICLVLVLLLPVRTVKVQLPSLGRALAACMAAAVCLISLAPGRSDLQYIYKNYDITEKIYPNTVSEINLLTDLEQSDEKRRELVDLILGRNGSASAAYAAAAQLYFQEGDIASMATYQKAAIRTDPYRYTLYTDYLTMLSESAAQYALEGRREEAYYCAAFAQEIPEMLEELKERTSPLGWQLSVQPVTELDTQSRQVLEEMSQYMAQQNPGI